MANEKVRQTAFSDLLLKEGRNSDVIELGKNHILVMRTEQHHPAKPKNLDEVKAQVEQALRLQKIQQLAEVDSQKVLAELKAGQSMADVAKKKHLSFKAPGFINRQSSDADRLIVEAAFTQAKPVNQQASYKTIPLARGLALVAVNDVKKAEKIDLEASKKLQQQMAADVSGRELMAFIGLLRAQADIIIADDLYNE